MFKSKRFYVNIAIFGMFLLLPFVPWYVPFILAIAACWHFNYIEIVFLGFLTDLMFPSNSVLLTGASSHGFLNMFPQSFPFMCTFISAGVYLVLQIVKKRVRFYA